MKNFNWKQTNSPRATRYDDLWFINENVGWTVNSNGQILRTNDGGMNWNIQFTVPSQDNVWLRCICFSDENNGWVGTVSSKNRLYHTENGGESWILIENLPSQPSAICGLCLVGPNVIYASGTNYPDRPTAIIKSLDAGKTWTQIDMTEHANLLVDIFFLNENIGWVVGGKGGSKRSKIKPVVLYTADGGKTWKNQLLGMDEEFPYGEWGWKIQFLNEKIGFISLENFYEGAILKTLDGGEHWERIKVNDFQKNANLEGIGFLNSQFGWVGGWGDVNFKGGYSSKTEDGGNNWQDANNVGKFINRFRFIGDPIKSGYASGEAIYKFSSGIEKFIQTEEESYVINNFDFDIYQSELPLTINVPQNSKSLRIDIWDRFGKFISNIANINNPTEGVNIFKWEFPQKEEGPIVEHYIYRVSIDEKRESGIAIRAVDKSGNYIARQLLNKLSFSNNTVFPTTDEEKEAFHRLVNIEDYPEFRDTAKKIAEIYLSNTDYNISPLYNKFKYTPEAFEKRMKDIYESYLPDMNKPHEYDSEIILWSNGKRYNVGKASNRVVKDRLLQYASFNLLDGVWLQNIMQARPSDEVQSKLFEIWADEVGNGCTRENHANVYNDLLKSLGIYLPEITSRDFLDVDFVNGAWRNPVFQLCIGMFPQHYFPELLGMTLLLEWEATPTLMPAVNMLIGRDINPLFYSLHVAIDNISEGHGALAKEAIKIYLEEKREEGGDIAVQQHWERIWCGYVGWATVGFAGLEIKDRRLILDKKSINIGTEADPICFPDWKSHYHKKMVRLIKSKAEVAKQVHGNISIEGELLADLFDKPEILMEKLLTSQILNIENPRQSKFFNLLEFEGPMYKVFTDVEKNTILDWLESLSGKQQSCINPLPDETEPGSLYKQITDIINKYSAIARRAHDSLTLPNETGKELLLISYFNNPATLLGAMIRGGWIIPGNSARSMFIKQILHNDGPMQDVFNEDEIKKFIEWIDNGANIENHLQDTITFLNSNLDSKIEHARLRPFIGQGAVH